MISSRLLARLALALGAPALAMGAAGSLQACGGDSDGGDASSCKRPAPTPVTGTVAEPFCRTLADCQVPENRRGQVVCTSEESASRGCGDRGASRPTCSDDAACVENQAGTGGGSAVVKQVCQQKDHGPSYCEAPCASDAGCAAHRQCDGGGHCIARSCGGAVGECPSDAFCAPAGACELKRCDPATATATTCGLGFSCSPTTYACSATPCAADPDCPDTFRCESGACARRNCACDNECGASGYCLKGICAETLGRCSGIAMCGRPLLVAGAPVVAARVWSADWSA